MKLFPEFDEVFYQADDIHKMLLFPLSTVDLNSLNKGNGKVHFVSVYGNKNINGRYNIENLIGNDIISFHWDGERYRFEGDLSVIPNLDNIPEWYEEAIKEYNNEYHALKDCKNIDDKNSVFYERHHAREKINADYANYIRHVINYCLKKSNNFNEFEFTEHCKVDKILRIDVMPKSNYIGRVQSQNDIIDLFIDHETNKVYERFNFM